MDLKEILVVGLCLWRFCVVSIVSGSFVFKLEHWGERSLQELKDHDARRHGRMLSNVDLPLGGDSMPTGIALYYTKLQLGNPAKEYHVQVDTGSDVMWLHCSGCEGCPSETRIKDVKLQSYDPKGSSSAKVINCDKEQCKLMMPPVENCKPDMLCQYLVRYGDGSSISGFYVQDSLIYDKNSSGDQKSDVVFGCASKSGGSAPLLVDGLIGFGQANNSVISQLAASGKVKKQFAHCLDNKKGGGILAVGDLVDPKITGSPIMEGRVHYNVVIQSIDVDGEVVEFPKGLFTGERGAVIDSGTTLGYLPKEVYDLLVEKISSKKPDLEYESRVDGFKCFKYSGKVDDDFPKVIMNFKGSLNLTTYPHEYLFELKSDEKWCIGWQSSAFQSKDGTNVIILGDMVLQNKLVYYDLENQTIGWTDYDCSSSIKLKDEASGKAQDVGAHNITPSSLSSLTSPTSVLLSLLLVLINLLFMVSH